MLINNIQKHRQRYSLDRKSLVLQNTGLSLNKTKSRNNCSKIQQYSKIQYHHIKQKIFQSDIYSAFNSFNHGSINQYQNINGNYQWQNQQYNTLKKFKIYSSQQNLIQSNKKNYQKTLPAHKKIQYSQKKSPTSESLIIANNTNLRNKFQAITLANTEKNKFRRSIQTPQKKRQPIPNDQNIQDTSRLVQKESSSSPPSSQIQTPPTSRNSLKSNNKSLQIIPQKTQQIIKQQNQFIKSLKFNDVLFCGYCFRYVFAIQKHYHYPVCQNVENIGNCDEGEKYKLGIKKLDVVLELAQYTKVKQQEIRDLYQIVSEDQSLPDNLDYQSARTYYRLQQIEIAAKIIIHKFIEQYLANKKNKKIQHRNKNSYNCK